jgi:hypothetical protein
MFLYVVGITFMTGFLISFFVDPVKLAGIGPAVHEDEIVSNVESGVGNYGSTSESNTATTSSEESTPA